MQFKHPEILWALFLLLIPIVIHLFQLRRFKKTPFTNVAMLQKVVSKSRKSRNLKKWLLLATRLLLLAALVIAFAQPFVANKNALTERETVIYLDNSFSMEAKKDGLSLLEKSIQDLIQAIPENTPFSLFTNNQTFNRVTIKQVQNRLFDIQAASKQLALDQILLKANSLFSKKDNTVKELLIISDLQQRIFSYGTSSVGLNVHVVQTLPDKTNNILIDSVYLGQPEDNQVPLHVEVSGLTEGETVPISLFDDERLIAKTAVLGSDGEKSISTLSLQKGVPIKGHLIIDDPVLGYDNHFYFNINERVKPKVLAISNTDASFLNRIYTREFEFSNTSPSNLNYSVLESQNTLILNGLPSIPNSLGTAVSTFKNNGGNVVIIPPAEDIDINSYNTFLKDFLSLQFGELIPLEQEITDISFQHPLYHGVFEKSVDNFDYPKVNNYLRTSTNLAKALSLEDGSPFLISRGGVHIFTASLDIENSNFINSPLIVPTFFNIGENSLKNPALYQTIGDSQKVDINQPLDKDNIIRLAKNGSEFIPLQQSYSNKVQLSFPENLDLDGIYSVMIGADTIQQLSFNFQRFESTLSYLEPEAIGPSTINDSIPELFDDLREDRSITPYWKWFVIFALLFIMLELLIQKIFP